MRLKFMRQWLGILCLTAAITACGGGGGSGGSNAGSGNPTTPSSSPSTTPTPSSPTPTTPDPTTTTYRVNISWAAPTTRADGSALPASALAGYRVFYVREDSSQSNDTVVTIASGATTSTTIALPATGSYTFAVTAIDIYGAESVLSTAVSVTVN